MRMLSTVAAAVALLVTGCGGSGHSSAYDQGFSAGQNLEHSLANSHGPSRRSCAGAEQINRKESSNSEASSSSSTRSDFIAGCLAGWKKAAGSR